ncbi:hypothetical protein ACA910_017179 [Epithemia clementina (nom. ined.)]
MSLPLSLLKIVRLICLLGCLLMAVVSGTAFENIYQAVYTRTRRLLNLGSLFGSATHQSPYDRISGHPVFAVTSSWGSPYMNMEKLSDLDEVGAASRKKKRGEMGSTMDESDEYRSVVLYFMDQDDALGVHGEMKQMEQMADADLRVSSFSFSKALRQAANLGNGLPTGAPPDPLTGDLKSPREGGSLRYKIVPSKRQLYYAARCYGRERVGLFSETSTEDAAIAVQGSFEAANLERRRIKKERKMVDKKRTPMQIANIHMEGNLGIPVFYIPEMKRVPPLLKRIVSATTHEAPLFFNYEDLMEAWYKLRERNPRKDLPEQPPSVEVFNLWDVLTSMDRHDFQARQRKRPLVKEVLQPVLRRLSSKDHSLELRHITFVPSSRSVHYKEVISARGNGKARLRPMRDWGMRTV